MTAPTSNTRQDDNKGKEDPSQDHKPLLAGYKAGFFLISAAFCVIGAFIPLYLKQLGLSPYEVGILMFCRQFGGIFGGVIAPYMATILPRNSHCYVFPGLFFVFTMALGFAPQSPLRADCPDEMLNRTIGKNVTHKEHRLVYADPSQPNDVWLIFFLGIVGFIAETFGLAAEAIQHGTTMSSLKPNKNTGAYGHVRAWAALGVATASISTGLVVNFNINEMIICSRLCSTADYHSMFYVFAFFAIGTILNAVNFEQPSNVKSTTERKKLMPGKDFRRALATSRNISWLIVLLLRSMFFGVTQGFLKWHMDDMGASPALIGLSGGITTVTEFVVFFWTPQLIQRFGHVNLVNVGILSYVVRFIIFSLITNPVFVLPVEILEGASPALIGLSGGITTVTEFVVFFWTPQLIQRFGHVNLVNVGILSYVVRFIIFSLITNPVFVLPVEILEGVMFACIWTSIVSHLSNQVPAEGQNQMQGLIVAVKILGSASGFELGGALTQAFGAPIMFRVFSGVAAVTWLAFFLAHILPDKSLGLCFQ